MILSINNSRKSILTLSFTLAALLFFSTSFSQWTRVQQLPASDIYSLYRDGAILYGGGKGIIYLSSDNGLTWDSTNAIPLFTRVDNIIVYKNELYAASYSIGIYKSPDKGVTWQNISTGIFPFVSDLCEWNGDLYAATLGSSVFKLDPVHRDKWSPFNNGLSNLSLNLNSIAGNNNALIAGTLANGMYDYLPVNSAVWEERFFLGQLRPTEAVYDIITAHDSLFVAGSTGTFYISTDNGLNWSKFGNTLSSFFTPLVNAKQALLLSRNTFDGINNNTSFHYIKKEALQESFIPFSFVGNHFSYKLEIYGGKLWDASTNGLFYMSLSDLPGISAADDPVINNPLPLRFIAVDLKCEMNSVMITWKAAQEQTTTHFNIERSVDGVRWTVISHLPAVFNGNNESSYSFTDKDPVQNNFYRIAGYDLDGGVQYSSLLRSSCAAMDIVRLWPNPVRDMVFVNVVAGNESQGIVKLFDSKGALIKVQRRTILQGNNQLGIDMRPLASGVYLLSMEWNNGQMKRTVQLLKQ